MSNLFRGGWLCLPRANAVFGSGREALELCLRRRVGAGVKMFPSQGSARRYYATRSYYNSLGESDANVFVEKTTTASTNAIMVEG